MKNDFIQKCFSDSPLIMGIVNVTPDSFSDGGDFYNADHAICHGKELLAQGADILDIGGESTRPNADTVSVEEEIERVVPVIEGLRAHAPYISIDTRNAQTMQAALGAGANIINDVSALEHDPNSIDVAARYDVPLCLMHMKGTPQTMQDAPQYDDVIDAILDYFDRRIAFCAKNGVVENRIILDPGIGFGKTVEHNVRIIRNLDRFTALGFPVLLGTSRKSFIGKIAAQDVPKNRLGGSLASVLYAIEKNTAHILRVHDVFETHQAVQIHKTIKSA